MLATLGFPLAASAAITLSPTTLPDANQGVAYTQQLTAAGGTAPYTFSITTGGTPPGMFYDATGKIYGTPTTAGTYSFTMTVYDNTAATGVQSYTLKVLPPPVSITTVSLGNGTVGASYTDSVSATGGITPYSFSITAGALPNGLSLSSAGVVSGTPTAGGFFSFTVTASDASSPALTSSKVLGITISPPTVTVSPTTLPGGTVGSAYSQTITASGGTAPYSYNLTLGSLPTGLSLSSSGALSGTPTASGTFNFTVTATDNSGGTGPYTGSRSYSITVISNPPVANAVSATVAYNAIAADISLDITGGTPSSVAVASAPSHGSATASGTSISYTPTTGYAGADSFTYTATNGSGTSSAATVSITVSDPVITVAASGSLSATVGAPYSQTFTWSGGATPFGTYQVSNLPNGLAISGSTSTSVTVSGTPTAAGSFGLTATATDSSTGNGPFTTAQGFTLNVADPTLALTPAAGTLTAAYGAPYSQSFAASGGVGPYTYALTGTSVPGLTFSSGTLSGTPVAPGSYSVTVTATDSGSTGTGAPFTITHTYVVSVPVPTILLTPVSLPTVVAGSAYTVDLGATGGVTPYAYALSAGALPTGLALSANGVLSGTPTETGTFHLTVKATDAHGLSGTRDYALVVEIPTLTVSPATLPDGTAGLAYPQIVSVSGGIAPYQGQLTGTLPAGMSFDGSTLSISGTPVESGQFPLSLTVHDNTGGTAASLTHPYTLTILAPTLTLSPAAGALASSTAGVPFAQQFTAAGGIAPYTYALATGALPTGLSLDPATGALSGIPTVAGDFHFSVIATDHTGGTAGTITLTYSLTLVAPTIALTPATLPSTLYRLAYQQALSADGGTAPYSFAVTNGALPPGLSLSSAGVLAGSASDTGSFSFAVTATDALGFTGTRNYTVGVAPRPDPSLDPEVQGLIRAQIQAAHRFGEVQINNFQSRLERLHGHDQTNGFAYGLGFADSRRCMRTGQEPPGQRCGDAMAPTALGLSPMAASGSGSGDYDAPFTTWLSGTVRSGTQDSQGGTDFETDGISAGIDKRIRSDLAVGAGIGFGHDASDVGNSGSRVRADAYTFAVYASYQPLGRFYLDSLIGYQRLSLDLRRQSDLGDGFFFGSRDGRQWLLSVAAGADWQDGAWQVTPYTRLDMARGHLNAYAEAGDSPFALAYDRLGVNSTTGNLGLRIQTRHPTDWGMFSPRLRLEYQHEFEANGLAALRYADLPDGPFYSLLPSVSNRNRFLIGLGGDFAFDHAWTAALDFRFLGSSGSTDRALQLRIERDF